MPNSQHPNIIDHHSVLDLAVKQLGEPCIYWSVIHYDKIPAMQKLAELLQIPIGSFGHDQSLFPVSSIEEAVRICNEMNTDEFHSIYVAAIHPVDGMWTNNN